ncbi:hypothetical protein HK096_001228, partial [Nowakowskiella sp. JEL0078]
MNSTLRDLKIPNANESDSNEVKKSTAKIPIIDLKLNLVNVSKGGNKNSEFPPIPISKDVDPTIYERWNLENILNFDQVINDQQIIQKDEETDQFASD